MYRMGMSFTDPATYRRGIGILRDCVRHGRERDAIYGRTGVAPAAREPVDVELMAPLTPGATIHARLRSSDLYLTSLHNGTAGFYFKGAPVSLPARTQETQVMLGFTDHYKDLGAFVSLGDITMGRIDAAIAAIATWREETNLSSRESRGNLGTVQSEAVRHILLLCLILSEAARFHRVAETVENALGGTKNTPLTLGEIDRLTRDWGRLSAAGDTADVALPAEPG